MIPFSLVMETRPSLGLIKFCCSRTLRRVLFVAFLLLVLLLAQLHFVSEPELNFNFAEEESHPAQVLSKEATAYVRAVLAYTKLRRWTWPYHRHPAENVRMTTRRQSNMDGVRLLFNHRENVLTEVMAKHTALQKRMTRGKLPLRALVAPCHHGDTCNGVGDRLFGLVILYLGALLTGRAFFVDHRKPLPLERYLEPNELNWRTESIESPATKRMVLDCSEGKLCNRHWIKSGSGRSDLCEDVLKLLASSMGDRVVSAYTNLRTECVVKILVSFRFFPKSFLDSEQMEVALRQWGTYVSHVVLNHLFMFTAHVTNMADNLISNLATPFSSGLPQRCRICVHVRTCRGEVCQKNKLDLAEFGHCARSVEDNLTTTGQCPKGVLWQVLSDSSKVASALKRYTQNSVIESSRLGPPLHLDKLRTKKHLWEAGMDRVFVDFYMLTMCANLVNSLSTLNEVASIFHGFGVRRHDISKDQVCHQAARDITHWQSDRSSDLQTWKRNQHIFIP